MELIVMVNNVECQVWQQVKMSIKIMWNLGEGQLLILMFTNNSEFIESKIIIKLVYHVVQPLLISLHQWIHK
jgi:hypothetical protein